MISGINRAFGFFEQALNVRAYRQQVLASNLANSDTPNYKARDVDFQSILQNKSMSHGAPGLDVTHSGHLQGKGENPLAAALRYRTPDQPSIDGNTVDEDSENAMFADNAIHYQANLTFINGKIRTLLSAIKEQ